MQKIDHMTAVYLNMEVMNCLSLSTAFPLAKQGLLPWKPELKNKAQQWRDDVDANACSSEVERALLMLSKERCFSVIEGVRKLHQIQYQREESESKVVWKEGSTTVTSYHAKTPESINGRLLFVPSLINRYYVFDMSPEHSMIQYFLQQGYECLLINWNDPQENESDMRVEDYVCRVSNAMRELEAKEPYTLIGYCMGGMMAMALAQLCSDYVDRLVLIATPWDFASSDIEKLVLREQVRKNIEQQFGANSLFSGNIVHQMMYLLDPWSVNDKYIRFAELDVESAEARTFIEREYWLHDNVDLTQAVAKQIFIQWALDNKPMLGEWGMKDVVIDPREVRVPTLIAISKSDKIVPPLCSLPLSMMIDDITVIYPATGHVGMVAGMNAKKNLWIPIESWLNSG